MENIFHAHDLHQYSIIFSFSVKQLGNELNVCSMLIFEHAEQNVYKHRVKLIELNENESNHDIA